MLRSLSWGSTEIPDPEPEKRRHHHHRHHHRLSGCHEKNYDTLPLGGNRPINISTVSLEQESRRERRKENGHHRRHRSRSSDNSRSSISSSSSLEVPSSRSSRHARRRSREREAEGVTRTESAKSKRSSATVITEQHEGGVAITSGHTNSAVLTPPTSPNPSKAPASPPLHQGSSMGIVISEGRSRRGTDGSETNTPYITTTPPTPSPLEQARSRNIKPHLAADGTPTVEFPYPSAPYPVTPPATDIPMEARAGKTSYLPYHPPTPTSPTLSLSDIHPALRPASPGTLRPSSPRQRSHTIPSTSPLDRIAAVEIGSSDSIPQRKPTHREDPYLLLRRFDTVIIVDDSLSMTAHWASTRSALETVATVALKHDQDGIDIHFMNHPEMSAWNVKSATQIRRLFSQVEPAGCTPTGECLDDILREYMDRYAQSKAPVPPSSSPSQQPPQKVKPLNILVLTDGEPTDDPESVIVAAARRLEALNAPLHQVGIQFLQIGDEPGAREALEELDDTLAEVYGIRDMVDTTRYGNAEQITGELLLKALLGGVNRRWDRK